MCPASAGNSAATSSGRPDGSTWSVYDAVPSGACTSPSAPPGVTESPPSGADHRVHSSPAPRSPGQATTPSRTQCAACWPVPGSGGFATSIVRTWDARS
ncbi:Uncharacterised protein [Mycobacteroides abscessus]|nr:Uncharacterised protein [Mycobacteroides abscessus]